MIKSCMGQGICIFENFPRDPDGCDEQSPPHETPAIMGLEHMGCTGWTWVLTLDTGTSLLLVTSLPGLG